MLLNPPNELKNLRLTQTVQKGGCAAKIAAATLREVLSSLAGTLPNQHPHLLVGSENFDDAGVYWVSEDLACVETLDFFTPIVDTPWKFGKIAAVNALSDVYAMGGEPKTCMAILAFPLSSLDIGVMKEVLYGAGLAIQEAGAVLVGGHSIDDDTLKFGLAVTGHVHPQRIWKNSGAQVGDDLILTKALGTGTLCAALKNSILREEEIAEAVQSMMTLNRVQDLLQTYAALDISAAIHGATDVTGFGLMGHLKQMAQASAVSVDISISEIPVLPLALESLAQKNLTKAHRTNREYTQDCIKYKSQTITDLQQLLLFDPQTSGGLLLSVDPTRSDDVVKALLPRFPRTKKIGKVRPKDAFTIFVS